MERNKIVKFLVEKGFKPHLKGFKYLCDAIEMVMYKDSFKVTQDLYPSIAERHKTTAMGVEKAIRHSMRNSKYEIVRIQKPKEFLFFSTLELM